MGVGLGRPLQPWVILLIYCNNQLKKYIIPLLTLGGGDSLSPFWCLCQKLSLALFHFNKTLLHKSSWVIKPGSWSRSEIFFGDHKSNTVHCKLSELKFIIQPLKSSCKKAHLKNTKWTMDTIKINSFSGKIEHKMVHISHTEIFRLYCLHKKLILKSKSLLGIK